MTIINFKKAASVFSFALFATPLLATPISSKPNSFDAHAEEQIVVSTFENKAECTATATVSIPGGSKVELSATAATCEEAIRMIRRAISKL